MNKSAVDTLVDTSVSTPDDTPDVLIGGKSFATCQSYGSSYIPGQLVGLEPEMELVAATWSEHSARHPFGPLLVGPPGVGKTSLVLELAYRLGKPLYITSGHRETRVDDVVCSPFPRTNHQHLSIEYLLQPLTTALVRGGIFFFDEIGRASSSVHEALLAVLDRRQHAEIKMLATRVDAHPDFRFIAASNTPDLYAMEDSIRQRLRPTVHVGYPGSDTVEAIVSKQFKGMEHVAELLDAFWLLWREKITDTRDPSGREVVDLFELSGRLAVFEKRNETTPLRHATPNRLFPMNGSSSPATVTIEHLQRAFVALFDAGAAVP